MRCFASTPINSFAIVVTLFAIHCLAEQPIRDGVEKPSAADQIRGDWVQYHETPNGRFMTIKEHRGDRTVITRYDPNQVAVYSHQSEYVVDESGDVPIFRYKNKTVLLGPKRGAKDPRENAYIFRVTEGKFYEVHGMLPNDDKRPGITTWDRLKINPIPKPAI